MTEVRSSEADASRFRVRALVIGAVVLMAFCLIAARLVYLQVVRHEDLAAQAESNRTAVVPIVPNRGLILDRNGVVLATSLTTASLYANPKQIQDPDRTAEIVVARLLPRLDRERNAIEDGRAAWVKACVITVTAARQLAGTLVKACGARPACRNPARPFVERAGGCPRHLEIRP